MSKYHVIWTFRMSRWPLEKKNIQHVAQPCSHLWFWFSGVCVYFSAPSTKCIDFKMNHPIPSVTSCTCRSGQKSNTPVICFNGQSRWLVSTLWEEALWHIKLLQCLLKLNQTCTIQDCRDAIVFIRGKNKHEQSKLSTQNKEFLIEFSK